MKLIGGHLRVKRKITFHTSHPVHLKNIVQAHKRFYYIHLTVSEMTFHLCQVIHVPSGCHGHADNQLWLLNTYGMPESSEQSHFLVFQPVTL